MDVRLPDGTVIKNVPEGTTKAALMAKLSKSGYDVAKLGGPPGAIPTDPNAPPVAPPAPEQEDSLIDKMRGLYIEPMKSIGTGLAAGLVAPVMGVTSAIAGPNKFGSPEFRQDLNRASNKAMDDYTYAPRTATGKKVVGAIGKAMHDSGIIGIPVPELNALGRAASVSGGALSDMAGANAGVMAAQDAAAVGAGGARLRDMVTLRTPSPAPLAGVGAAEVTPETLRAQRFANMRAPMQPTKGILSRNIDDVQFEREAAKRPEGKALDNRFAELNRGMERHMDAIIDETGAQASSSRATGKAVTRAMEMKKEAKKKEISAAYKEAERSGAMAEQVDIKPLLDFVNKNRSAASTAKIVTAIEKEVERLSGGTGKMSINDMEQLRQMTRTLAEPGTPNGAYGTQAVKLIDDVTANKGGPAYQQARRMYENYANEFKNREAVAKLLRTKRGTKDRAIATEDVADHIVFEGSLDDMKHAFRVLEAHPVGTAPEIIAAGKQAANELRGAAATKLKEQMFSNAGADSAGRVVGSEAKIKRIVSELDKDGKLDVLFGKKGAQEIRDTVQVATDMYSTPKGTVNSSNTASAMEKVLERMAGTFGGTPGAGHAIKYAAKKLESRNYKKRVDAALEPNPKPKPGNLSDMSGGN
jgi:hypothetical protein